MSAAVDRLVRQHIDELDVDRLVRDYVITKPEIVRARRVFVEAYRRLTDFPIPPCVVREIEPALELLEMWVAPDRSPHLDCREVSR